MIAPGVTILPFNGVAPCIAESAFIAPGCRIIGDVEIGEDASIWYNCVVRGDVNRIRIGARTNVQDGSVIHCDSPFGDDEGYPTLIGDDVLIGHMAMLHGCVLADSSFVGLGAVVMNGARIASDGMLAAGAMLTPGKAIGEGELWVGRPARLQRMLSGDERRLNRLGVMHYVENARAHALALSQD